MYPTEYLTYGLGNTSDIVTTPDGPKTFLLKDHLGSTRIELTEGGGLQETTYEPYGAAVAGDAPRKGFIDREKDKENTLGDFGVRKYDDEIGRFLNPDPLWEKGRDFTPYQYSHNNPLSRFDRDGRWDITVYASTDRDKNPTAIAVVTDRHGKEIFRFTVKVIGTAGRDRMREDADTPFGTYDIAKQGTWRYIKKDNPDERASYGPYPRLVLTPSTGEAAKSGRTGIQIHGGRQEGRTNVTIENVSKTHGCMRALDADINTLKQVTDKLEETDSEEEPGTVSVVPVESNPVPDESSNTSTGGGVGVTPKIMSPNTAPE